MAETVIRMITILTMKADAVLHPKGKPGAAVSVFRHLSVKWIGFREGRGSGGTWLVLTNKHTIFLSHAKREKATSPGGCKGCPLLDILSTSSFGWGCYRPAGFATRFLHILQVIQSTGMGARGR
jgi:hypothetical protein